MAEKDEKPQKKEKKSALFTVKKNVTGVVATSSIGKAAIKSQMSEDQRGLLKALKKIIKKESNAKASNDVEQQIFKIFVKAKLLVDNKNISVEQLQLADKPMRDAFDILVTLFNDYYGVDPAKIDNAAPRFVLVEKKLRELQESLTVLLKPHVTEKTIHRLAMIFDTLAPAEFLRRVWKNPNISEELDELIMAINRYTQFS